jgi:hypothetical protein
MSEQYSFALGVRNGPQAYIASNHAASDVKEEITQIFQGAKHKLEPARKALRKTIADQPFSWRWGLRKNRVYQSSPNVLDPHVVDAAIGRLGL